MANSERRISDIDDKMFIPRNVDGGIGEEHFITGPKLFILGIVLILCGYFIISYWLTPVGIIAKLLVSILIIHCSALVIRYAVLNERYYYKMYNIMKEHQMTTPASFWGIVRKEDLSSGCVVTFTDMKTGIFLRLERDSIIGKAEDFKERHYDIVSAFYRDLLLNNLKFVKFDVMEPAGKDKRMQELDELVNKAKMNENLYRLIQTEVGHIKNIAKATLYESEYLLVYLESLDPEHTLLDTVTEVAQILISGGYSNVSILNAAEIDELVRQTYGVKRFDSTDAIIHVFQNAGNVQPAFKIKAIQYTDGTVKPFTVEDIAKLDTPMANRIRQELVTERIKKEQEAKMREKIEKAKQDKNKKHQKYVQSIPTYVPQLSNDIRAMYDLDDVETTYTELSNEELHKVPVTENEYNFEKDVSFEMDFDLPDNGIVTLELDRNYVADDDEEEVINTKDEGENNTEDTNNKETEIILEPPVDNTPNTDTNDVSFTPVLMQKDTNVGETQEPSEITLEFESDDEDEEIDI